VALEEKKKLDMRMEKVTRNVKTTQKEKYLIEQGSALCI
jgi:hypothetical protein